MRVLFVDDEPRVLEAIERTLFQLDLDWEVSFAEGGSAALAELEKAHFDVVVSDMRMPGMDGATFLNRVRDASPATARTLASVIVASVSRLRSIVARSVAASHGLARSWWSAGRARTIASRSA